MEAEIVRICKLYESGEISEEEAKRRLKRYGRSAFCSASYANNLDGHIIGIMNSYCHRLRNHEGPHKTGPLLREGHKVFFAVWEDGDRPEVIVVDFEV